MSSSSLPGATRRTQPSGAGPDLRFGMGSNLKSWSQKPCLSTTCNIEPLVVQFPSCSYHHSRLVTQVHNSLEVEISNGYGAFSRPMTHSGCFSEQDTFVLTFFLSLNEHCPTHRCVEPGLISQGNFKSSSKNLCFVWLRMPAGVITQQGTSAAFQAVPVVKINSEAPASQGCQSSRNICF